MKLEKLHNQKNKWVAIFDDGKKTKFGAEGYEDYTQHHDKVRRLYYRRRHEKDLRTNDPRRAGFLSFFLLWGASTSLEKNLAEYKKEFAEYL
jgi:hypothetical protein